MDLRNLNNETETNETNEVQLIPREITLTLSYTTPTGERYDSAVRSRIPDGDGRMMIDRRVAILAGVPWSQLSEYAQARITALATVSVYLVDMPDWVNQWIQEDDDLLFTLRGEVESHALAWFRSVMGESATDEEASRVSISTSYASTAQTSKQ